VGHSPHPTPIVTTCMVVELVGTEGNYSGRTPELVSGWDFHVTLSAKLYKGRQGPPPNKINQTNT
jgi:hypothetical protein